MQDPVRGYFGAKKVSKWYTSVKQLLLDTKNSDNLLSVAERFCEYLSVVDKSKKVLPYTGRKLRGKGEVVCCLSKNLQADCPNTDRPIRESQLYILGEPKNGRTTFLEMYKDLFFVYDISKRKDYFSGACSEDDLWIIEESTVYSMYRIFLYKILDSEKNRLDAKYGRTFMIL